MTKMYDLIKREKKYILYYIGNAFSKECLLQVYLFIIEFIPKLYYRGSSVNRYVYNK